MQGWCVENAQLSIVASDPQGFPLTITGTAGQPFSCGASCIVALPEGTGTTSFTISSTSGRTASGSLNWKYDASLPTSAVQFDGTAGANGWYVSAVTVSGIGTDTVSGMATLEVSVNGGAWQPSVILLDGVYRVQSRSTDNAGWEMLSAVQTVRVDTLKPELEMVPDQTKGGKDYFHRAVTVSLKGTDAGSGVARVEYRLDGGNWVNATSLTISTDGGHGLEGRVTDNAGNVTWKVIPVYIDTIPPVAAFVLPVPNSTAIESGTVLVGGNASDIGSGVERVELSLDQGKTWQTLPLVNEIWNYNWDTLNIPNGRYQVIARAWDIAGNVQSPVASITLVVDNQVPDKATATLPAFTDIPLTATYTSTPTPSPTTTITATPTHHIQPTQTITTTPRPTTTATPVSVSTRTEKPLLLWPTVGLIGILTALASASLTDHRPQALRMIGKTFHQIVAQKKLDAGE